MDPLEDAARLRHYGLELIKLAADMEAQQRHRADFRLPMYQPRFEVIDGVELITDRLACCGSGNDRLDERTGERLHLPGCPKIAAAGLAECRAALGGDWTDADDERVRFEEQADAGRFD